MFLCILVCIPFIFGCLCLICSRVNLIRWLPRWIALCGMFLTFAIILFLWLQNYYFILNMMPVSTHDELDQWVLEYKKVWIPKFGICFHLALDGLSLLMVVLSSFLGCIAVLCSWNEVRYYHNFFYCNLLWILGSVIGVFLSIDMFLFFFFWEIMLVPTYFLISLWGRTDKFRKNYSCISAATKFFLYNQFGGLCMLIAIIALVVINFYEKGLWSFSYQDLLYTNLSKYEEYLLMLGFFIAFAVKIPVVPFHTWLPYVHSYSSTAGSIDLSGLLLKTAAYGLLRFSLPLFPHASNDFSSIVIYLSILNIFYGAYMALAQTDIKCWIAYTNISHMGFILLAIYSCNYLSYQGAIIQMISHSLSTAGMFVLCGQLYERLHTQDVRLMGGLWNHVDLIPAFSLCFIVSMFGLPGTGNFIGEITIFLGNFKIMPIITIIAAFGMVFTALYSLVFMQRVYYGSISGVVYTSLKKMTIREKLIIIVLLLCLFILGLYPKFIFDTSHIFMKNICNRLQSTNSF